MLLVCGGLVYNLHSKMFHCKLLSESEEIEPNDINVSFTVLPTMGGEGKAVVGYSVLGSESEPLLRDYSWTVQTRYFIDEECKQALAISDVSVTCHRCDGPSTTEDLKIASLPQIESSEGNVLEALDRSGVPNPTHRDFTIELKQLKGPSTVQFSLSFIAQLTGSVDQSGALQKLIVRNTWPCRAMVNYSVACLHFKGVKSVHLLSDPPIRRKENKAERMLMLSYQRERGSGRADVEFEVVWAGQEHATAVISEHISEKFKDTLGGSQVLGVHLPALFQREVPHLVPFPQEFVFLVDCSGSMSGSNMHEVVRALHIAVRGLPLGSYFNVIAFGSKHRPVFLKSVEYTQESLDKATTFVSQLDAKLGGTELLTPLKWIGRQAPQPGLMRHIFVITDGQAPHPSAVLGLVQGWSKQTICHVVAIGDEVCRTLVGSVAALSGGSLALVSKSQELPAKVLSVLEHSMVPHVGSPSVCVDVPGCTVEEQFCQDHLLASPSGSTHYFILCPDKSGNQSDCSQATSQSDCSRTMTLSDCSRAKTQSDRGRPGSQSTKGVQVALSVQGVLRDKPVEWTSDVTAYTVTSSEGKHVLPMVASWNKLDGMLVSCLSKQGSIKAEDVADLSKKLGIRCPITEFSPSGSCPEDALPLRVLPTLSVLPRKQPRRRTGQAKAHGWRHARKRTVSERESTMSIRGYVSSKVASLVSSVKWVVSSVLGRQEEEGDGDGYSLDDMEMDEHVGKGLRWGEHGQLVFPSYYYSGSPSSSSKGSDTTESGAPPHKRLKASEVAPSTQGHDGSEAYEEEEGSPPPSVPSSSALLRPTDDFVALLKLQLFNGAWPLDASFAAMIGRTLADLEHMVCESSSSPDPHLPSSSPPATALAVVFLRKNFPGSAELLKLPLNKAESWLSTHDINWDKLTDLLAQ